MRAFPVISRNRFLTTTAWWSNTVKVYALSSAYTYSAAHQFITSVTGIIATGTLATLTTLNNQAKAANTSLGSPTAGQTIVSLMFWKDTGVAGTSWLMYFTNEGTRLPMATYGLPITIEWLGGVVLELGP